MNCRIASLVVFSLLVVSSTGCRMCSSTYDYCGPTFNGRGPECSCDPLYRAGSIIYPCGAAANGCQSCNSGVSTRTPGSRQTPVSGRDTSPGQGSRPGQGKRVAIPQDVPNGIDLHEGVYEPDNGGDYRVPGLPERQWVSPPNGSQSSPNGFEQNRFEQNPVQPVEVPGRMNSTLKQPRRLPVPQDDFGLTLEELRREDPSITNVEIVSVEELGGAEVLQAEEPRPLSDVRVRYADTPWQ